MISFLTQRFNSDSFKSLFRYGVVGVVNNLFGYVMYLILTYLGVDHKFAMTFLYMLGSTIGFLGNRQWAFSHKGNVVFSAVRYCIAHVCGYLLNLILLVVFVDKLGYSHQLVQVGAIGVVAIFLYIVFRMFVFRNE